MNDRRAQTAIGGVVSVFAINATTRVVSYFRHIVITAYLGLTGGLDAFFAALSTVGIFVMVFGDIFDSIGVPRLVRARLQEGEERFKETAGQVMRVSLLMSLFCVLLLSFLAPFSHIIFPGFHADQKDLVGRYVIYLVPMALVYLPYHAMGSILRSQRMFRDFYIAEFFSAVASLVIIALWHSDTKAVPISTSFGFLFGTAYLIVRTHGYLFGKGQWVAPESKAIMRNIFSLLPSYLVAQLILVTDRAMGSYLPAGSISALFYGLFLATGLLSLFAVENVFVTPLAEVSEKGPTLSRIMTGIGLVFIPVTLLVLCYAHKIVSLLFERGMFDKASVDMTAGALRYYVIGLPAWALWGILVRLHQVLEKFRRLLYLSVVALFLNFFFCYLLAFQLHMGLRGLALGTVLSVYTFSAMSLRYLRNYGIALDAGSILRSVLLVGAFSGMSILAAGIVPWSIGTLLALIAKGIVFAAVFWIMISKWSDPNLASVYDEIIWNLRVLIRRFSTAH